MMTRFWPLAGAALLCAVSAPAQTPPVVTPAPRPADMKTQEPPVSQEPDAPPAITLKKRYRSACPIRFGGVYTHDLASDRVAMEPSAADRTLLSRDNETWLREHCDVFALDSNTLHPDTFPRMVKAKPDYLSPTPLLFVYASSLYEQPNHKGSVGSWQPAMTAWTLRDAQGREVKHPDKGGHWMDFGSTDWAAHWRQKVLWLASNFGAQGVVAAELPIGNTFVPARLKKYPTQASRMAATTRWLDAAHAKGRYLLIPSALGFDALTGHPGLPPETGVETPALAGRLWDDVYPLVDGAWAEGWVQPYWSPYPLPEDLWEQHLEAADRASFNDQVFLCAAAYRDAAQLEYALASYLLIARRQGRAVFQPMPVLPGKPANAGFSLAMLKAEWKRHEKLFNAPLGVAMQQRHLVPVEGGNVWRREYTFGVVYVNSSDTRVLTVRMGGAMRRLNGTRIRAIVLPPHSGTILMYI